MTVQEYIDQDFPFYHISNIYNKDNILRDGLFSSNRKDCRHGICVVRSMEDDIISEIIDRQLQNSANDRFMLIKLQPGAHGIRPTDVSIDPADEVISPMCNFICKEQISIQPNDIIQENLSVGRWRETQTKIQELTNYLRNAPSINL